MSDKIVQFPGVVPPGTDINSITLLKRRCGRVPGTGSSER